MKLTRLSACQRDAASGLYAAATAGFVAWLAPRYAEVRSGLDAERVELRDRFVGRFPHARTPDIVANLLLGLKYLLRFAEAAKAVDPEERAELWRQGEAAFRLVAEEQGEHQRATDPVARFPEMLAAILSSGRGHVAATDGTMPTAPPSPEAWGWEARTGFSCGRGNRIGWVAGHELYLDPDSTYAALCELARDQGQGYPVTAQTLCRRLKESGLLVRTDSERTTYPVMVEGRRCRVLILAAPSLFGTPGQPGQPGRNPSNEAESVPVSRPGFVGSFGKPGQKTGTLSPENPGCVPVVPVVPVSGGGGGVRASDEEVFTP